MSYRSLWALICLLGWTSLQATNTSIDSSEAGCIQKPKLIDVIRSNVVTVPEPKPYKPTIYAFVFNNNRGTKIARNSSNGYLVSNPLVFNTQGPRVQINFNSKTGELIIPVSGSYELTYSVNTTTDRAFNETDAVIKSMAIAVNGKVVALSEKPIEYYRNSTGTTTLSLTEDDRVSLVFPGSDEEVLLKRNGGKGNSASLFIKKL